MRAFTLLFLLCAIAAVVSPGVEGDWLGKLNFNGTDLRIALHIKFTPGGFTATMDSLDQGAPGIPVSTISLNGDKFSFEVAKIGGSYEGSLSADGKSISGTWSQGGVSLPLNFTPMTEAFVLNRPQEPKPPYPYVAEEVGYNNPQAAGVHLAGTLTKPKGDGPFPAVLLITGSGAQNRDEEIFGHKPFLVLADYLTRRGIAVLRVDDRSVGGSTGDFKGATTEDFAGDVMAGVRYLLSRSDMDKHHIGLIGHSEGGVIAPMVANRMSQVAFIVMLAGSGVPGDQVVSSQTYGAILKATGSKEEAAKAHDLVLKLLEIDKNEADPSVRERKMLTLAASDPALEVNLKAQLPALNSVWYRFFITYDPAPSVAKLKCPVLALVGAKDQQVDAELNVPPIKAALAKSGNKDVDVQIVPGVNHLFQEATTGAVSEYGRIEQTMSPKVLDLIANWIQKHV